MIASFADNNTAVWAHGDKNISLRKFTKTLIIRSSRKMVQSVEE